MNPYAKHLEGQNYLDVLTATPGSLAAVVQRIGDAGLKHSYSPGKWSAAQILCHLADCEVAFGFRIRQAFVQDPHLVQPFDQDAWSANYGDLDPHLALETFTGLRNWNLALLRARSGEISSRKLSHPERGDMTLEGMLQLIAGHDLNHRKQLEAIASAAA